MGDVQKARESVPSRLSARFVDLFNHRRSTLTASGANARNSTAGEGSDANTPRSLPGKVIALQQLLPVGEESPFGVASEQEFRPDIQGLRALAVLLVIADHAGIPGFPGGYIGVDLFFVVSGFVITQLVLREARKGIGIGLRDFYARRVRRIVPAATATLVATVLISWATLGTRFNPQLPADVRWASLFAGNLRLIETGSNYFVPGIFPSLITQFWSLGVEEQFYLCFPLVVFLIARFAPLRAAC